MEALIFLLVVIIIIIANIVSMQKKLKKSAPPGKPRKASGWKQNLKDLLAEMQREMQAPSGRGENRSPAGRRPSGWEDLMPAGEAAEEMPEEAGPGPEPRVRQHPEPARPTRGRTLIESRSRQGWTPEARIGKTERRAPVPPLAPPAATGRRRRRRRLPVSRKELRRAVVWYEILGPPMSLRDPEREMWL